MAVIELSKIGRWLNKLMNFCMKIYVRVDLLVAIHVHDVHLAGVHEFHR